MASQLAEILNNYRQTMPEAGAGLAQGAGTYLKTKTYLNETGRQDQQNAIENALSERRSMAAETAASAAVSKEERAARFEQMKQWAGAAASAVTPEKWTQYQEVGWLPKGMEFKDREPLMMAVTTESERFNREKETTRQGEFGRTMGFNQQKETTRQGEWSQEMSLKRQTEARLQKFQSQVKGLEKETGQALEIRQDPLGLDFMVLDKNTKEPIAKINSDGEVSPIAATPGSPLGNTQPTDYRDYFK